MKTSAFGSRTSSAPANGSAGCGETPPLRVVIIDPAACVRGAIRVALAPLGCQVQELSGREPEAWRRRVVARADVLVVEPAGHGEEASRWLQRLRAHNPRAALIICTAWTSRQAVFNYQRAGAWDVVAKPFPPQRLWEAVQRAARRPGRRPGRTAPAGGTVPGGPLG